MHGFARRKYSDLADIVLFIQNQLRGSGALHGYRMMHSKCIEFGLSVRKEDVRLILKELDPVGVNNRLSRRLSRRRYFAEGPNAVWHVDGYDKLSPFGLCINGCVDGFSRKVVWLNVYNTNSDPRVIGGYYLEAVRNCNGCPRRIRADFGTENVLLRDFQQFLRRADNTSLSYVEGASTLNQRIESWWGHLRRQCIQHWQDLFKDLHHSGDYSGDFLDKNIVRFTFTATLQNELDDVTRMWNRHIIRPVRNSAVPSGRPLMMYTVPALWGATDKLSTYSEDDIDVCNSMATFRGSKPCDEDVYDACISIMRRDGLAVNFSDTTALVLLYLHLRCEVRKLL